MVKQKVTYPRHQFNLFYFIVFYLYFQNNILKKKSAPLLISGLRKSEEFAREDFSFTGGEEEKEKENGMQIEFNKLGSSSAVELDPKAVAAAGAELGGGSKQLPPASVMTRLILIMVWRKLIRNPNTYSSLIGLIWSLVSFR